MENEIGIWFLLLGLIAPRFTLFFWWITGNLPVNDVPFVGDFFATLLVPRILILVYIYGIQGMSAWFVIHLAVMALSWIFYMMRLSIANSRSK